MSFETTVAFVEQYRNNILLLSQQMDSRLRMTCQEESVVGRTFYGERVGATAGADVEERHGDTPLISTPHSRRRWAEVQEPDMPHPLRTSPPPKSPGGGLAPFGDFAETLLQSKARTAEAAPETGRRIG